MAKKKIPPAFLKNIQKAKAKAAGKKKSGGKAKVKGKKR
jgi:hypothetical protein